MLKFNHRTGEWEGTTGGVDIVELNKRTPQPKVQPKEKTQNDIRQQILQDPNYGYALRLTEYVLEQLELKIGRTIFRNIQGANYDSLTKQIRYGYECVDNIVQNGFNEYAEVGHIWVNNGFKGYRKGTSWKFENGKQAIWMLVLHEVAHAVQHTKNGFWRGSIHNHIFLNCLEELIILFPYNEVKNI